MNESKGSAVPFRDQTLGEFLAGAASKAATPGGGAVSAICAAMGASMGAMAARLTMGKKRFREIEPAVTEIAERLDKARESFLGLADIDSAAYAMVQIAWEIPNGTEQEKAVRAEAIRQACATSMRPPLEVAHEALRALKDVDALSERFNTNLASDVAVAAHALAAGVEGALAQVETNLSSSGDETLIGQTVPEVESIRAQAGEIRDRVAARIGEIISP